MTNSINKTSPHVYARVAGFAYLITIMLGIFSVNFVEKNIVAAIFKIIIVVAAMIGEIWMYYIFASIVELILLLLIVWYAWNWPKKVVGD